MKKHHIDSIFDDMIDDVRLSLPISLKEEICNTTIVVFYIDKIC